MQCLDLHVSAGDTGPVSPALRANADDECDHTWSSENMFSLYIEEHYHSFMMIVISTIKDHNSHSMYHTRRLCLSEDRKLPQQKHLATRRATIQ